MREFPHTGRGVFAHPEIPAQKSPDERSKEITLAHDVFNFLESKLDSRIHLHERIRPALALYLFNTLRTHADVSEDDIERIFDKMFSKLMHAEEHALRVHYPLPPIGIELEIEEGLQRMHDNRNDRTNLILGRLDIRHTRSPNELLAHGNRPTDELEVNPYYAYSAATPARLIQELAVFGAVRTEVHEGGRRVARDEMYSLHINLGIDANLRNSMHIRMSKEMITLNTLCTLAFTSPERLQKRKSTQAANFKTNGVVAETEKQTTARIELRAFEFRDYPTYRLLYEIQLLSATALAYERINRQLPRDTTDERLANIWLELRNEPFITNNILYFEGEPVIDRLRDDFIALSAIEENKKTARTIITKYAQRVKSVLKEEY